jgi:site-specific DNA-methyltransferase (adenine-specific)
MSKYQTLQPLTPQEYNALRESIRTHGILVEIAVDEHGNIIDGHHRYAVAKELGIPDEKIPKAVYAGLSEQDKRTLSRTLNATRRQLNASARRALIKAQILDIPTMSDRQIASALSCSPTTVGTIRRELEETGQVSKVDNTQGKDGKQYPRYTPAKPVIIHGATDSKRLAARHADVVDYMRETGFAAQTARKHITREKNAERKDISGIDLKQEDCKLYCSDIRTGLDFIENESIDWIITDPPYEKAAIPLYEDLARLSARVLKPGGCLVVLCGKYWLDRVMIELAKHLDYHSMCVYSTPKQSPRLHQLKTTPAWKPLLWYRKKGDKYDGRYIYDWVRVPYIADDRELHPHIQSLGAFLEIVEVFTEKQQIILDPFCGSGTTAIAGLLKRRRVIACDINMTHIETTQKRIFEETGLDIEIENK